LTRRPRASRHKSPLLEEDRGGLGPARADGHHSGNSSLWVHDSVPQLLSSPPLPIPLRGKPPRQHQSLTFIRVPTSRSLPKYPARDRIPQRLFSLPNDTEKGDARTPQGSRSREGTNENRLILDSTDLFDSRDNPL